MFLEKSFSFVFIEEHTWERNEEHFTEIFSRILQGIKSLPPPDPNSHRQQTVLLTSLFLKQYPYTVSNTCGLLVRQPTKTHALFMGKGPGSLYMLKVQLYISIGCKVDFSRAVGGSCL